MNSPQRLCLQDRGGAAAAETAVKKITGWGLPHKEFLHNVFLTNNFPKLNLWEAEKDGVGAVVSDRTLSLDSHTRAAGRGKLYNRTWLCYHACKKRPSENGRGPRI